MTSSNVSGLARETLGAGVAPVNVSQVAREALVAQTAAPMRLSGLAREAVVAGVGPVLVSALVRETVVSASYPIPSAAMVWAGGFVVRSTQLVIPSASMTWSGAEPVVNPNVFEIPTARMTWSGDRPVFSPSSIPFDWTQTVISQYLNSPTLLQMVANMASYIDPRPNFDAFYDDIWNIYTAQGYGLDVWGRIVGVERIINIPEPSEFLGFQQALPGVESFNHGIFFNGSEQLTSNYTLTDNAFRTLILAKALANICDGSIPAMNQILINLFGSQYGNVYVTDGEDMSMTITFSEAPSAVDYAIISQSGVFPRPTGVALSVVT